MTTKPSNFTTMTVTLVLVSAVAAVSLGWVYEVTKEPIALAKIEKQKKAITAVAGEGENDVLLDAYEVDQLVFYPVIKEGKTIGYAVKTFSEQGYSGLIEIMVGIDREGVLTGIQVLTHKETPGLGSKISDEDFIQQYIGQSLSSMDYRVKKDGGDVDAISGATISTRAVGEAIERSLVAFEKQ